MRIALLLSLSALACAHYHHTSDGAVHPKYGPVTVHILIPPGVQPTRTFEKAEELIREQRAFGFFEVPDSGSSPLIKAQSRVPWQNLRPLESGPPPPKDSALVSIPDDVRSSIVNHTERLSASLEERKLCKLAQPHANAFELQHGVVFYESDASQNTYYFVPCAYTKDIQSLAAAKEHPEWVILARGGHSDSSGFLRFQIEFDQR